MQEYHDKAKRGIKLLLGRQIVVQVITFGGGIILARTLDPADFGLYVISAFMVGMFALIGDFGLAPSFIQRKQELTDLELQVGFTVQQILTSVLVLILLLFGPSIASYLYPQIPQVRWLVRVLSLNLYLTSWRSMSALQLERHMKYDKLAKIEVSEILLYQVLAVTLALMGAKTWSYIVASLAQGLFGTILIYSAAPWPVRLKLDQKIAKDLMQFGVPFQLQIILNSIGGWITPLIVGRQVGPNAVGYITWASSNGRKPLMVTDSVMRVAFPHFSRIQEDLAEVERIVMRYLSGLLVLAMLWFTCIVATTPGLVELIYKTKWVPAVPALIMYSATLTFDMMSMIVGITLNGIGRLKVTTRIVAARTVINIVLAIIFVHSMAKSSAYNGVPLAFLIASAVTVPWMIMTIRPGAARRIIFGVSWLLVPTSIGIFSGLLVSHSTRTWPLIVHVVSAGVVASTMFGVATWFSCPSWMKEKMTSIVRTGREKAFARSSDDQASVESIS
jgi:O-antigen/teichoic acid export membrane protein